MLFQLGDLAAQTIAQGFGALGEALFLHYPHVPHGQSAGGGVPPERVYVAQPVELFGPRELLVELALDGGGGERQIGTGYALRHRDDIGLHAVVLVPESPAGPPEAADHLVDYQERAALLADLPHSPQVVVVG